MIGRVVRILVMGLMRATCQLSVPTLTQKTFVYETPSL